MNNRENEKSSSILALGANITGDDHWIGDVHGGLTAFKMWMDTLKPGDRGFCAGDLVDRGEDSPGVIAAIIENNKNPDKAKVYVLPGNHEEITINAISALEVITAILQVHSMDADRILKEIHDDFIASQHSGNLTYASDHPALIYIMKTYPDAFNDVIATLDNHLANGGTWLVELFAQELKNNITTDSPESRVRMILDYMTNLPDILYVDNPIPVVGVHADMPFEDKELIRRARLELGLTPKEKNYSIWAREPKEEENPNDVYMTDTGRTPLSILAIVGHNIVGGATASALRLGTNTMDLDFASFLYGAILSVNITKGTVSWVHPPNVEVPDFYKNEAKLIEKHLVRELELAKFTSAVKNCAYIDELADVIEKFRNSLSPDKNDADKLIDLAFRRDAISETLINNETQKGDL